MQLTQPFPEHLRQPEGPLHADPRDRGLQGRDAEEGMATVRRAHGCRGAQVRHREDGSDVRWSKFETLN